MGGKNKVQNQDKRFRKRATPVGAGLGQASPNRRCLTKEIPLKLT